MTSSVPGEHLDLAPPMAAKTEESTPTLYKERPRGGGVVEIARDIWRSPCPTPLLKKADLKHVAQENV